MLTLYSLKAGEAQKRLARVQKTYFNFRGWIPSSLILLKDCRAKQKGGKTGDRLPSGLMDFDISDKSAIEATPGRYSTPKRKKDKGKGSKQLGCADLSALFRCLLLSAYCLLTLAPAHCSSLI